jgi:hypothetical protein
MYLLQRGSPNQLDVCFGELKSPDNFILGEIKEHSSRLGDPDISGKYNESGKFVISENYAKQNPELVPIIEHFNKNENVFA